jgi:hypothetical protein
LGSVIRRFVFGWREVAEVAVQAAVVVPIHPAEGGEFDVLDGLPRTSAGGAADQFGLVVAVDGLSQGVDAPIAVKCPIGL